MHTSKFTFLTSNLELLKDFCLGLHFYLAPFELYDIVKESGIKNITSL